MIKSLKRALSLQGIAEWLPVLFAYNLFVLSALTWGKWVHPYVDSYQSMYIFRAVAEGKMLYRDVSYYFGPFAPYLHAWIFQLLGVHLKWLFLIGHLIVIAVSILLFLVISEVASKKAAWIASFIFLNCFAFNNLGYSRLFDYIVPYSYSSVYSVLFLLLALLYQMRTIRTPTWSNVFIWSIATAGIALNRPAFGFVYFVASLGYIYPIPAEKRRNFLLGWYFFPCAILVWFVYGSFLIHVGFAKLFFHNIFWIGHLPYSESYQVKHFGFEAPEVFVICTVFLLRCLMLLPLLYFLGWQTSVCKIFQRFYWLIIPPAVAAFHYFIHPDYLFADYQLILLFSFFFLLFSKEEIPQRRMLIFLNLLSLLSISRIFFRLKLSSYFFYMGLLPFAFSVVLADLAVRHLTGIPRKAVLNYLILFVLIALPRVWWFGYQTYKQIDVPLKTVVGTLYVPRTETSRSLQSVVNYISNIRPQVKTVLTIPEGASISFFTETEHTFYHPTVLPHVISAYGEENIVEEIATNPPEVIVFLHRYSPSYGNRELFSKDYGKKINAWVMENYEIKHLISSWPFVVRNYEKGGALILVRKKS